MRFCSTPSTKIALSPGPSFSASTALLRVRSLSIANGSFAWANRLTGAMKTPVAISQAAANDLAADNRNTDTLRVALDTRLKG